MLCWLLDVLVECEVIAVGGDEIGATRGCCLDEK